jgi:hypothetical protein
MNWTSLRFGTRRMTQGPSVKSAAAMIGSAAFLAPLILTFPRSGTPPLINRLSILQPATLYFCGRTRRRFNRGAPPES